LLAQAGEPDGLGSPSLIQRSFRPRVLKGNEVAAHIGTLIGAIMSRLVKLDGPGKHRSQIMRTAAEVIRRLSEKPTLDDEARDMAALLIFCFREIEQGIDESVVAWEKRDYWVKAERFRSKWAWAGPAARELERVVMADTWDRLPLRWSKSCLILKTSRLPNTPARRAFGAALMSACFASAPGVRSTSR
jgi:hypothetical protein